MKLAKRNENGKAMLKMSKNEWLKIGEEVGWEIPDEILEDETISDPKYKIEVRQYGEQDYWVFVNGELLATLKHTKGEMSG